FFLPDHLLPSLRTLTSRTGSSVYMALVAAFVVLLQRYDGQDDIVIGGFSAGRKFAEFETLAGYFVNPIPLRFKSSIDLTFHEFLSQVRTVVLNALAHDDVPFTHLVQALRARPD